MCRGDFVVVRSELRTRRVCWNELVKYLPTRCYTNAIYGNAFMYALWFLFRSLLLLVLAFAVAALGIAWTPSCLFNMLLPHHERGLQK